MSSQSSQASRAIENLGPAEFQRKVSELVRYMLCQDKKKLPIKRPDINRNVLKEHVRCFQPIFEKAKEFLLNIFGIDVVESEVGKTKSYFLVNDLDTRNEDVIPCYIIKEKVVTPDLVTFNYKMGPRTMAETSKRRILEFISEIYGVDIQQWKMQYKEIVREEGQQQ
eukprot:gene2415-18064_t